MSGKDEYIDLGRVVVARKTAKAMLLRIQGEDHWIPTSQTRIVNGNIKISKWIAEQKGIVFGAAVKAADGQYESDDDDFDPIDYSDREFYPDQLGIDDY